MGGNWLVMLPFANKINEPSTDFEQDEEMQLW
jgi:hypothetical protein